MQETPNGNGAMLAWLQDVSHQLKEMRERMDALVRRAEIDLIQTRLSTVEQSASKAHSNQRALIAFLIGSGVLTAGALKLLA